MDNNVSVAATNFHAVIAAWPLKRTWQEDVLEKFPEPRDHLSETDNLRFSRKRVFEDKALNPLREKCLLEHPRLSAFDVQLHAVV